MDGWMDGWSHGGGGAAAAAAAALEAGPRD